MELLKQAQGLFLGPPSPAARNLRCTLGDPGTRLMVTCSNRQLMASVLGAGAGAGAGGGKGSDLCPCWCDCALLCLQQCSLNVLVVSRAMRMCAQREEVPADTVQGSENAVKVLLTAKHGCTFSNTDERNNAMPQYRFAPGHQKSSAVCATLLWTSLA